MIKKKKWRYYCEYCGKSSGSGGAMSVHEKHCTMNPNRICRLCVRMEENQPDMKKMLKIIPKQDDYIETVEIMGNHIDMVSDEYFQKLKKILPKLREIANNCPNCIFSALRQCGIHTEEIGFDYKKELSEFWSDMNSIEWDRNYY